MTAKESTKAVQEIANNKASENDNLNVQLIKYALEKVHKEMSKTLNGIFETNNEDIKLEIRVLLPPSITNISKEQ